MAESNAFIRETFLEMHENETVFDPENLQSIWRILFVGAIFQTKMIKPHFWVLDGLDECPGYSELFPLLTKISSTFSLQIFLSSRPSPEAQSILSFNGLKAEIYEVAREKTAADIKRYIETHIDFPSMQKVSQQNKNMAVILEKSEGSFVWVRLVLRELRGAFSEEATQNVLRSVPKGMDQIYLRSLEPLAREEMRRPAAKAILMWASACVRPIDTVELKHALIIHIDQTFNNLKNHISWLCGFLVTVDGSSAVKLVHETARRFILDADNGSAIAFDETEAHEELAIVCLKYLNDKQLKAPRGRRSSADQATSTRSPFLKYAAMSFHEHIHKSKTTSEQVLNLLHSFCSSSAGNILTWIEYIASAHGDLAIITRVGLFMHSFVVRVGRERIRRTEKLDLIGSWSTDLIRIVAKFGRNMVRFPASIYTMIPQFCPRKSALFQQYGHSQRTISVLGLPSLLEWDDCLATVIYKQKGTRAMSVAATGGQFAIGMVNSFARLYHINTCQEFALLHHAEPIKVIEFNISGQWLATSGNKRLCLWDVAAKSLVWESDLARACVAMTFDEEEEELVVACQDNQIRYFSIESGQLQEKITWFMDDDHVRTITNSPVVAALSYQHELLAFVYRGGHIGIWNWKTDEFLGLCEKPEARTQFCPFHATSLVFSPIPSSNSLAASYEQGDIFVFSPLDGKVKASYKARTDNQTLACSPDGKTLIAGDSSGVVRIFDFQSFDTADHQLRLLHIISGAEENITALAFCDDRRYVDIRGAKVKVWEPAVLVRQDLTSSDTESITLEALQQSDTFIEESNPVTSLAVHPSGKHVFCATENGIIHVYDTATGKRTQALSEHSRGDTILRMIFSPAEDVLVVGCISSKVVIHRLALKKQEWHIQNKVFEYRMGERIEQLLFDPAGKRILVVTTTRDMVYSLADGSMASASWDTRLPGVWCNDPRDSGRLLLWVNQKMRVFSWTSLTELLPGGLDLDFDLPDGLGIQSVYAGWKGSLVATVYTEIDRARSNTRLLFWDAAAFDAAEATDASASPCPIYQLYGDKISNLVGTLGTIIGLFENRILFLDQDGWVCSIFLEDTVPETYSRYFFLPVDWLSTDNALLITMDKRNQILLAKGDELAVIKRGLDFSQEVPIPSRC